MVRERFLEKTKKTPDGCWEWTGWKDKDGYGTFWWGRTRRATRVAHELFVGPLDRHLEVGHSCDNPSCVNPDHLFACTRLQNEQDKDAKGRRPQAPRACKLNEGQVRAIYADQRPQTVIAAAYGIHQVTVSEIKTEKIWRHLWAA